MKKNKILYWIFTGLICLLDGLIPALTSNTELAKQGISHLGYPDYFRVMLTLFKVAGALILILPVFRSRIKEWAYAGFTFNFFSAFISGLIVDGFSGTSIVPIVALGILAASYFYYHRIKDAAFVSKTTTSSSFQLSRG